MRHPRNPPPIRYQPSQRERDEKLRLQIAGFNSSPFRQEEIRRREEQARRREQAEQQWLAEQRRQEQIKERQRRQEQIQHSARVASLESQWSQFSRGVAHQQRQQMRQAFFQRLDGVFNELDRHFNPPAPALEPLDVEVIYVSEDEMGSPRLGSPDFNARLFAQPLRWR